MYLLSNIRRFAGATIALIDLIYPTRTLGIFASLLSIAEVSLLAVHEQRLWSHTGFPWHGRVILIVTSFLLTATGSWFLFWAFQAILKLQMPASIRFALSSLFSVLCSLAVCAYIASWSLMWRTGIFADGDAIAFAGRNISMLAHYLRQNEPVLGLILVFAAGIAAILGTLAFYLWTGRCQQRPEMLPRWQGRDGMLVLAMSLTVTAFAVVSYGDPPGPPRQTQKWWKDQRPGRSFAIGYRVNPLLTVTCGNLLVNRDQPTTELTQDQLGPTRTTIQTTELTSLRPKLSLVLIEIESLRHDLIGLTHQGAEVMPALNRLAAGGVHFTRAYAPSTHSNYSDPAILSSLYPLRTVHHHYYSYADPWPRELVYDVAKRHGCATAVISSQNETWGGMNAFLETPQLDLLFDSRSSTSNTSVPTSDITFARFAASERTAGKLDDRETMSHAIKWIQDRHSRLE
ncbi:MAG TPA: sulfatase-like hydrolase/transferase, partial [Terriglobales bacterium]